MLPLRHSTFEVIDPYGWKLVAVGQKLLIAQAHAFTVRNVVERVLRDPVEDNTSPNSKVAYIIPYVLEDYLNSMLQCLSLKHSATANDFEPRAGIGSIQVDEI